MRIKVNGEWIWAIKFADNQVIMKGPEKSFQKLLTKKQWYAIAFGMKINASKTKMMIAWETKNLSISFAGNLINRMKIFSYFS